MLTVLLVLGVIYLLVSGQSRLSAIGKGLGEGTKAFRKAWHESDQPPAEQRAVVVVSVQPNDAPSASPDESEVEQTSAAPHKNVAAVAPDVDSGETPGTAHERR